MSQKLVFLLILGVLGVILTSVPLAMAQEDAGGETTVAAEGADAGAAAGGGDAATEPPPAGDGETKPEGDTKNSGPGDADTPAPPAGELKCYQCIYAENIEAKDAACKDFNAAPDDSKLVKCDGTPSALGQAGLALLAVKKVNMTVVTEGEPACIISKVEHEAIQGGAIYIRDCAKASAVLLGQVCVEKTGADGGFSGSGEKGWGCACNTPSCNGVKPDPGSGGTPGTPSPTTPSTTTKPHNPTDAPEDAGTAIQSSILCILGTAIFLVTFSAATGI